MSNGFNQQSYVLSKSSHSTFIGYCFGSQATLCLLNQALSQNKYVATPLLDWYSYGLLQNITLIKLQCYSTPTVLSMHIAYSV